MTGEDLAASAMAASQDAFGGILDQVIDSTMEKLSPLVGLFKIAGIIFIIYIFILILKELMTIGTAMRIKEIAKNVESMNSKLDTLINNTSKKEDSPDKGEIKHGLFRKLFTSNKKEKKEEEDNKIAIAKENKKLNKK